AKARAVDGDATPGVRKPGIAFRLPEKACGRSRVNALTGFEPVFQSRSRFRQHARVVARQEVCDRATRLKHAARSSFKYRRILVQIAGPQSPISNTLIFEVDLV